MRFSPIILCAAYASLAAAARAEITQQGLIDAVKNLKVPVANFPAAASNLIFQAFPWQNAVVTTVAYIATGFGVRSPPSSSPHSSPQRRVSEGKMCWWNMTTNV